MAQTPISSELDALSCDLLGQALDALAAGVEVPVLVSVDAGQGAEVSSFSDDSLELCLEAARSFVRDRSDVICYAIVYDGDVALEGEAYQAALILEFGEKGAETAYSGYVLYDGFGAQDDFAWADPEPAGTCELLV
jgi:hypothetical protein